MCTSSSSHHPSRVLPRQLITSKRCLRPARQSLCKPAAKHSGNPRFKHGGPAVCRVPPTANSRTCHHEPSTRPSPACARASVLNRKQPPIQLKSTVLALTLRIWNAAISHIRYDTGEIMAGRNRLSEDADTTPQETSRALSRLTEIGALLKLRRGRYAINPHVGWTGSLVKRQEAAKTAPSLRVIDP